MENLERVMKVKVHKVCCGMKEESSFGNTGRRRSLAESSAPEQYGTDPKDDDLYLGRVKPAETQVEARSVSDVQIVRQTWVKGRKTHRIV